MPYTAKQKRLFEAAAHNKKFAKKVGMPMSTAKTLAKEAESTATLPPVKTSVLKK